MVGPRELDAKNTYKPNLKDINESAKRTFGAANSYFRKEILYISDVTERLYNKELENPEDIYDEAHTMASDLAKCCEMYLKAIYIYEHNISEEQIDHIWNVLKSKDYETDKNGNRVYMLEDGTLTYAKYDENGNPCLDNKGNVIYIDCNNNTYNETNRGRKIQRSGHYLDRLIELLSPESRILLETRMITIPMNNTENNESVTITDLLQNKGIVEVNPRMSHDEYEGWVKKHRKTFEDARFSGELNTDVSVEFLFHLATQIKAVAQYIIDPRANQRFDVYDEELVHLPLEIRQFASLHPRLLSEPFVKLVSEKENYRNKLIEMITNNYILPIENITAKVFYNMFKDLSLREIQSVAYLCWNVQNYEKLSLSYLQSDDKSDRSYLNQLAFQLGLSGFDSAKIVKFCVTLKASLKNNIVIGSDQFYDLLTEACVNADRYSKKIIDDVCNNQINFNIRDIDIYNYNYKK